MELHHQATAAHKLVAVILRSILSRSGDSLTIAEKPSAGAAPPANMMTEDAGTRFQTFWMLAPSVALERWSC